MSEYALTSSAMRKPFARRLHERIATARPPARTRRRARRNRGRRTRDRASPRARRSADRSTRRTAARAGCRASPPARGRSPRAARSDTSARGARPAPRRACAMPHEIDRLLATPTMRPCFPDRGRAISSIRRRLSGAADWSERVRYSDACGRPDPCRLRTCGLAAAGRRAAAAARHARIAHVAARPIALERLPCHRRAGGADGTDSGGRPAGGW